MLQPPISFFEDALTVRRGKAVVVVALISLVLSFVAVVGLKAGAVDEMDFWGGTCLLVAFGTVEAFIFSWVFGIDHGWEELGHGAHITLPRLFKFIMKYITPFYLCAVLVAWLATDGWKVITLRNVDAAAQVTFLRVTMSKVLFIALLRGLLIAVWGGICAVIYWSWKYHRHDEQIGRAIAAQGKEASHA
jgi:NSS family neurotransmitter:Na+ symporter